MSDHSDIEWTEATWNPITGCSKVSAGCKHCYALREWPRLAANPKAKAYYGREFTDVQCHTERLDQPLRWKKSRRIFVNSMSDLFHAAVPFEFIAAVFGVMAAADRHFFQVLTKRPQRMLEFFRWVEEQPDHMGHPGDECRDQAERLGVPPDTVGYRHWPLSNVWLGVSVEDQATADERVPLLLETPAAVRWLSMEPLLGPVSIPDGAYRSEKARVFDSGATYRGKPGIDWVVVGGESGPKARPMHPEWVRSLRDQCNAAGVPFFFKQWGEWSPEDAGEQPHTDTVGILPDGDCAYTSHGYTPPFDCAQRLESVNGVRMDGRTLLDRVGKKRAGRALDGRTWDEYPNP